jgi:hypothetical protein
VAQATILKHVVGRKEQRVIEVCGLLKRGHERRLA